MPYVTMYRAVSDTQRYIHLLLRHNVFTHLQRRGGHPHHPFLPTFLSELCFTFLLLDKQHAFLTVNILLLESKQLHFFSPFVPRLEEADAQGFVPSKCLSRNKGKQCPLTSSVDRLFHRHPQKRRSNTAPISICTLPRNLVHFL